MEETLVEWKNEGGGQAGGRAELRVAFGRPSQSWWSDNCPCWTLRCRKVMAGIYIRQSILSFMMSGVTLDSRGASTLDFPPSYIHLARTTHTRVAQHGHSSST